MNLVLISLAVLGVTGLVAAVLLYFVAQKFKVEEDPRIDQVQEVLPGANCGGCGSQKRVSKPTPLMVFFAL